MLFRSAEAWFCSRTRIWIHEKSFAAQRISSRKIFCCAKSFSVRDLLLTSTERVPKIAFPDNKPKGFGKCCSAAQKRGSARGRGFRFTKNLLLRKIFFREGICFSHQRRGFPKSLFRTISRKGSANVVPQRRSVVLLEDADLDSRKIFCCAKSFSVREFASHINGEGSQNRFPKQ